MAKMKVVTIPKTLDAIKAVRLGNLIIIQYTSDGYLLSVSTIDEIEEMSASDLLMDVLLSDSCILAAVVPDEGEDDGILPEVDVCPYFRRQYETR